LNPEPVVGGVLELKGGAFDEVDWNELQTLDYMELTAINELATSVAFYPLLLVGFIV
jgi:hypothetical protein